MTEVQLDSPQPLHQLLAVYGGGRGGVDEVHQLAMVGVNGVDAEHGSVLGKTLAQWRSTDFEAELAKALEVDPFALMAQGWAQLRQVLRAVQASRVPPLRPQTVALLKHDLEAKLEPHLVLQLNGVDWCDVTLAVSLKLAVEGAQLEFTAGALTGLALARPVASLTLKCEGKEVAAFKRSLKLLEQYRFSPPLAWPQA